MPVHMIDWKQLELPRLTVAILGVFGWVANPQPDQPKPPFSCSVTWLGWIARPT